MIFYLFIFLERKSDQQHITDINSQYTLLQATLAGFVALMRLFDDFFFRKRKMCELTRTTI